MTFLVSSDLKKSHQKVGNAKLGLVNSFEAQIRQYSWSCN